MREAVLLQEAGQPDVSFEVTLADDALMAEVDGTMLHQALTNLIKNAGEAIESLYEKEGSEGHQPQIRVTSTREDDTAVIRISDNGIGLPEDRSRLFEPYVTSRAKGTGLGLPIVKKIIEEHGGTLVLSDADPLDGSGQIGARAEITLPLAAEPNELRDVQVAE